MKDKIKKLEDCFYDFKKDITTEESLEYKNAIYEVEIALEQMIRISEIQEQIEKED